MIAARDLTEFLCFQCNVDLHSDAQLMPVIHFHLMYEQCTLFNIPHFLQIKKCHTEARGYYVAVTYLCCEVGLIM